jgi:hypothetical protein
MPEFLQYLFGRLRDKAPITHEVDGQHYAVTPQGTLGAPILELVPQFEAPTFPVSTLSALVDLYKQDVDEFSDDEGGVALHVVDYRTVRLVSKCADGFGRRHVYAIAKHEGDVPFEFGKYHEVEKFLIDFQASFFYTDEAMKVRTVVSSVQSGKMVATADDGLSQQLEIRGGTVTNAKVVIPADGIELVPWRTFRDAAPVASKFLLRLKEGKAKDDPPNAALFEIDQKWKLDTVNSVAHYLRTHVPGAPVIA